MPHLTLRHIAHCALLLSLWLVAWPTAPAAQAEPISHLVDVVEDHDLWPMARIFREQGRRLTPAEALSHADDFEVPEAPHANLGVQRDAVWVRVNVMVDTSSDGDWILDIDYPALDEIAVSIVRNNAVELQTTLGRELLFDERPLPTRSHAMPLHLEAGASYVILLRVQTQSSMILPLRLVKPGLLSAREARIQLLQGAAAGIGLCLVLYAFAHWVSLREPSFLYYAIAVGGITLFFFTFEGLSAQHLWGGSAWLTTNAAPLLIHPSLTGGLMFLERTLRVRQLLPWLGRLMLATAAITLAIACLFALGIIDYRQTQLLGTILGPAPILLGLPAAWIRAREGDRIAVYILFGWGIYAIGIFTMAALLRGLVGVSLWTQYAFQAGALAEMIVWVMVLGVKASEIRHKAEWAEKERRALHRLAHTDGLTGLLNRRGLRLQMEEALGASADTTQLSAVYLLDLDGFKAVNDQLGHNAGDALLQSVARRLRAALRSADLVARIGGDEFVIMARQIPSELHAHRLGQKLLDVFAEPFGIAGRSCSVGLTIGYALAPIDGTGCAQLLKAADAAMYAGKQAGKNCVRRGQRVDDDRQDDRKPPASTTKRRFSDAPPAGVLPGDAHSPQDSSRPEP